MQNDLTTYLIGLGHIPQDVSRSLSADNIFSAFFERGNICDKSTVNRTTM